MNGYRIMRAILSPIYKFWYRPKIEGKENILEEGSIILAGNHIHIMDQCNVIVSTKRKLHYMAKKEYFDDKKVAWFFRFVGYIPVDRKRKDENAKEQAIEYGHSFKRELCFLGIHGLLHLLGYDHMNESDEKIMFELQERILDGYGIKR